MVAERRRTAFDISRAPSVALCDAGRMPA
eukprot:COSAG06_NODE_70845_length_189_cov_1522.966667_1_plen_28_part_01